MMITDGLLAAVSPAGTTYDLRWLGRNADVNPWTPRQHCISIGTGWGRVRYEPNLRD